MTRILITIVIGVMCTIPSFATEPPIPIPIQVEGERSENQLTPNQIEQIIRFRRKMGSSLRGSFLEQEPLKSEAAFREALYQYSQHVQDATAAQSEILPRSNPAAIWPTVPGADPLVHALRHTSLLLEQRSHQLQVSQIPANNRGLRRLAKRLR